MGCGKEDYQIQILIYKPINGVMKMLEKKLEIIILNIIWIIILVGKKGEEKQLLIKNKFSCKYYINSDFINYSINNI